MVSKPDYIKGLEDGKPFSTLELDVPDDFPQFLLMVGWTLKQVNLRQEVKYI
jgi:hypothetical protein